MKTKQKLKEQLKDNYMQKVEIKNVKPLLQQHTISGSTDWDSWLLEFETNLKEIGYIKFVQNHNNEDFCYWKTFKNGEDKIYQIGVLFYDFRKYADIGPMANRIGVMYKCMLLCDDRIDMDVSKEIDLPEFENMSKTFYEAMSQYCH